MGFLTKINPHESVPEAPASKRFRTIMSLPTWTARSSGVKRFASWVREFTFTLMLRRKRTLSRSFLRMAVWRKFRPRLSYCSAADGSMFRIFWAALLFLKVMAVAKGERPDLSRAASSIPG